MWAPAHGPPVPAAVIDQALFRPAALLANILCDCLFDTYVGFPHYIQLGTVATSSKLNLAPARAPLPGPPGRLLLWSARPSLACCWTLLVVSVSVMTFRKYNTPCRSTDLWRLLRHLCLQNLVRLLRAASPRIPLLAQETDFLAHVSCRLSGAHHP